MTLSRAEIEQILRDYHWMVREMGRLLAAQHEPPPTDSVQAEMARRSRPYLRVDNLQEKVSFINDRVDLIADDRERTVLDCILDGMSMADIVTHLRSSMTRVWVMKDNIVNELHESQSPIKTL